jgi:hypothetical protein
MSKDEYTKLILYFVVIGLSILLGIGLADKFKPKQR